MFPKNIFRVKEALLSVLAGDIFGKTPDLAFDLDVQTAFITSPISFSQSALSWAGNVATSNILRPVEVPPVYNA